MVTMTRRTETSPFGVNGRNGHDSSGFYGRRIYGDAESDPAAAVESLNVFTPDAPCVPTGENPIPEHLLNRVVVADSANPAPEVRLPDNSVHLAVTSPPYCVGKDYDSDLTLAEYLAFLKSVWTETCRILVPGGRLCVNIANIGRKPYIPLHAYIIGQMAELGFNMRGEIIWDKAASAGSSSAWGSWLSASNPCLRDQHEYILIFSKGDYKRVKGGKQDTITRDDFMDFTRSVWRFSAESAKRIGHPAPFPVELPRRCIELYSFAGDVIFDPFAGSGTACVAAKWTARNFVGYELNPEYAHSANIRLDMA